ncbi:hypothetical protein GCM10025771_30820 [Niveibacterium umoris]|uniref:GNAT superfamily N-acetyltransferase n=1 Tax=Niveibacterium umoris TaxID=1193620 RepID=A0A840BEZ4_9RHOO|nr:GNAT family N-acetyltransferase [Niveibacterium umoris]MBB4011725.1 GNAT superfamily N-acetyltransferase [Niveibacterium umoris]
MQARSAEHSNTFFVHAYPSTLIDALISQDENAPHLIPAPSDAQAPTRTSPSDTGAARVGRMHANRHGLSDRYVHQISCVDLIHQMGFVITTGDRGGDIVIADACYVLTDDGDTAEFAITVSFGWQGRGLENRLIDALCVAARRAGARWLCGEVFASNTAMLALMHDCGFTLRPDPADDALVRVERNVNAAAPAERAARLAGTTRR